MQRIVNFTAIFVCFVIGIAMLAGGSVKSGSVGQTAKVKKVGSMTNKEMAKIQGGTNNQRCLQASYNCPAISSVSCYILPHNLQVFEGNLPKSPCGSQSYVDNGVGGEYYECSMDNGTPNYESCGTTTTKYCQKRTMCIPNSSQGYTIFIDIGGIGLPFPSCHHETGCGTYCGFCEDGNTQNVDGRSSQRCVPD